MNEQSSELPQPITIDTLTLDPVSRHARVEDRIVALAATEYRFLVPR